MKQVELFNDHFQNFKKYLNCKAQLIIADPPYNLGKNAYASNPQWYVNGDRSNGRANLRIKNFLILIIILSQQNLCIFVLKCLLKNLKTG